MPEKPLSHDQFTKYMDSFAKTIKHSLDEVHDQLGHLRLGQEVLKKDLRGVVYRYELESLERTVETLTAEVKAIKKAQTSKL